jgi:outer membrane lipoprotein-sorting protein
MRASIPFLMAVLSTSGVSSGADVPAAVAAKMDLTAQSLKSFSADMSEVDHTAIVNDDAKTGGVFRMRRVKPGDTRLLIDYKGVDARTISFEGGKVQIFYPKINTVQVYQVGDKRSLIDQFLLLGFGATIGELKGSYDVSWLGAEAITGVTPQAAPASHLKLIPKSAEVLRQIKQVDLWVNEASGLPVQQKFLTSNSGDYKLVTYSNEKQNPALSDKDLKLNLPKGAVIQNMPR